MDNTAFFAVIMIVSIFAAALGFVLSSLSSRHQIDKVKQKYIDLNEKLSTHKNDTTEKFSSVERMKEDLESSLTTLTSDNDIDADLSDKDRFVETLLKPLQESLRSADQQAKRIIKEGQKVQHQIQKQLDILHAPLQLGRGDVKELAASLGDAESRGLWGLKTLKNLLEMTYMTDHYRMNNSHDHELENKPTPCLIKLPNNTQIAIDSDTPLEAYVNICQAPDASVRSWHLETHARKLRERILEMASRTYLAQYETMPSAQILMILNDHYLATALEIDNDLLDLAQKNNLILATPTDLFNLFQTVSFGWRQQEFSNDARKIRETGIHLYKRFGTFIKLIAELGSELGNVLTSYNKAVSVFGSTAADAEKRMQDGAEIKDPLPAEEHTRKSA